MADDKKKTEPAPQGEQPFTDHRRNLMTIIVVGALMLVEGVGIFVAVRLMGAAPQESEAAGGDPEVDAEGNLRLSDAEIRVTDVVAFNSKTGRVFVFQMSIYAEVEAKHANHLEKLLELRNNSVEDRFSRIVRACDPKYLDESGLETLKRQFKMALSETVGPEIVIKRILIPQFSKSRAD